ncbi:hypothetical protein ACF1BN_01645 [Streptomyces sp. NPDC014861]
MTAPVPELGFNRTGLPEPGLRNVTAPVPELGFDRTGLPEPEPRT